jgi:hypothetical protein
MAFELGLHPSRGCSRRDDTVIFGARNDQFSMLAPYTPKQNRLLAALPDADYDRLLSRKTAIVDQPS